MTPVAMVPVARSTAPLEEVAQLLLRSGQGGVLISGAAIGYITCAGLVASCATIKNVVLSVMYWKR